MRNKALVIGIDDYAIAPQASCIADAIRIKTLLQNHADSAPNFDVNLLQSDDTSVTRAAIIPALDELFTDPCNVALLYFAGHGRGDPKSGDSFLITQDGEAGGWGVSFTDILSRANRSKAQSTVIILDCCDSGAMGEAVGLAHPGVAAIGAGVTILTASDRGQSARSGYPNSVFTSLLIDGLEGAAADIVGRITPASLYSHIDQALASWSQRPLYKTNVRELTVLRQVEPKAPLAALRRLAEWFPTPEHVFKLDPSYEPEAKPPFLGDLTDEEIAQRRSIFGDLQRCNRQGLIAPVGADHMYHAAIFSKGCRLTSLGQHFRRLAADSRI